MEFMVGSVDMSNTKGNAISNNIDNDDQKSPKDAKETARKVPKWRQLLSSLRYRTCGATRTPEFVVGRIRTRHNPFDAIHGRINRHSDGILH
jgi:hypothetical protein